MSKVKCISKLKGFTVGKKYEVIEEFMVGLKLLNDLGQCVFYPWDCFQEVSSGELDLKYDKGKNQLSLIEPNFILGVGEVLTYGASKYKANSWQTLDDAEKRYKDALLRHTMAYLNGEKVDEESKISHLKHMATNIMFLQYFDEVKQ